MPLAKSLSEAVCALGKVRPLTQDSPAPTSGSLFNRPSAWDVVYSVSMGIACMIAYAIGTTILDSATARDDDMLGGMWAAAATRFSLASVRW